MSIHTTVHKHREKKGVDVWIGQYDIKTAVMLTFVNEIKVGLPDDDS